MSTCTKRKPSDTSYISSSRRCRSNHHDEIIAWPLIYNITPLLASELHQRLMNDTCLSDMVIAVVQHTVIKDTSLNILQNKLNSDLVNLMLRILYVLNNKSISNVKFMP